MRGIGIAAQVGVVLQVLHTGLDVGPPAGDVQLTLQTGTHFLLHVVIVPTEVVGVVMTQIERGQRIAEGSTRDEVDRVLPEAEVEVHGPFDTKLPCSLTSHTHFPIHVIVQQFAFTLGQFATDIDLVLRIALARHQGRGIYIHQVVTAHLVRGIGGKSGLGILVESLQEGDAKGVLHTEGQG